jgi:RHS repeat-associated protein
MVDASGTNGYAYDLRDRLLTKITPQGTLTYTYDGFGNLTSVESSTANGTKVNYNYDALNRLTNAVDRFTNNTFYAFDGVGNLQTVRYRNNVTNTYAYNALNRLTNLTAKTSAGTIASFAYRLASGGNRTNLIENINGTARTSVWSYDSLYRLTNEVITGASPTGTIGYKYDAVGNRTNRTSTVSGVGTVSASFNGNDQLTTDTYDSNGSTTGSSGNTYAYDVENHLTNFNNGAVIFVYDRDGNRVRKTVSGVTTYYLMDDRNPTGHAQVLEEMTTVGSTPSRLYTHGLDLISQRQSDGTTHFYGFDGNGNVRFLTTTSATISDTYTYDAFGIQLASTGSTPNSYRYSGQHLDSNLGFYYLRARYMNPATGRFLSRDKFQGDINEPATLHKYLYVANDPLNRIDPSGLLFTSKFGNAAHAIIQAIYVADHPGEIVIVGSTRGLLGSLLKPDILNVTPTHKVFAEIKPISLSGVAKGLAQMAAYGVAFGVQGYTPDVSWQPSTHVATVGTVPIVFINVGGLIFYSDAVPPFLSP